MALRPYLSVSLRFRTDIIDKVLLYSLSDLGSKILRIRNYDGEPYFRLTLIDREDYDQVGSKRERRQSHAD
ncbi:hypothetical protein D3C73_402820 [compost metagenome]